MRIAEIANNVKYRKENNSKIWQFFEYLRNFKNLLISKFDNAKILLKFRQFRKLSNFHNWNFFLNLKIYKIHKIYEIY